MALAGQCDDARARANRELNREHANATARPGDNDRLAHGRRDGTHGGHPSHACDEQRARHLPWDRRGLRRQVGGLDEHVLGVACAVVGKADHLLAHGYARHVRADLLDHAGEVRPLAARKSRGKDVADPARTDRRLAGIDTGGAHRHEHLAGPGLGTRHVAYLEDLNPTVLVESDCLHQPVTFPSECLISSCSQVAQSQRIPQPGERAASSCTGRRESLRKPAADLQGWQPPQPRLHPAPRPSSLRPRRLRSLSATAPGQSRG